MKFKCPNCSTTLQAEPELAGKTVRCPACDTKLQIPAMAGDIPPPPTGVNPWDSEKGHDIEGGYSLPDNAPQLAQKRAKPQRSGWIETDPTNPNPWIALAIGLVIFAIVLGVLFPFQPDAKKAVVDWSTLEYLANVLYKHLLVNATNVLFFGWAVGILYLKFGKARQQRAALMLDVLPAELGNEITPDNVGSFIDHVYSLPHKLRDSMMVNRIRKVLELFENRPSLDNVTSMMHSQSEIDGARIMTSYTLVKAFLWAIPIMGFIGTVLGLSHAIGGMNLGAMSDPTEMKNTIGAVVSGLGTAFDATLVGLILAVGLNFPMNSLLKVEDDTLSNIDQFCTEVLLPRLNDGSGSGSGDALTSHLGDMGGFAQALAKAMSAAQQEFLDDLRQLTAKVQEQALGLDRRADAHQAQVSAEFSKTMIALREGITESVTQSVDKTTDYVRTLASALQGLNGVLRDLGEKQVLIQQVKKKGFFGR